MAVGLARDVFIGGCMVWVCACGMAFAQARTSFMAELLPYCSCGNISIIMNFGRDEGVSFS